MPVFLILQADMCLITKGYGKPNQEQTKKYLKSIFARVSVLSQPILMFFITPLLR